jgi:hypothetical protein
VKIPDEIVDNDSFSIFDPSEDAIDFYESLEGMLIEVNNAVVAGPQKYGDVCNIRRLPKKIYQKPLHQVRGFSCACFFIIYFLSLKLC